MFRLETLGGLALAPGPAAGVTTQRRRLALLALLAVADERGLTRDKLVAYLWPEAPAENARHALEQLVYAVRRQLGESALLGPDPLRLNPEIITADVTRFGQAIERGAPAEAIELYRGPFLDGVYLSDADEFERWAEEQRSRLAGKYAWALAALADQARERTEYGVEVGWRRKLVALDHLNGASALSLLRALADSGDSTGALQYARVYEQLMREELDSPPDPAIQSFVHRLRAAQAVAPPPVEQPSGARIDAPAGRPPAGVASPRIRPRVGFALGLIIPLALALALGRRQGDRSAAAVDPNLLVVAPFRVSGPDTSLRYLREGIVDLLATKLPAGGGPTSVDPRTTLSAWRGEASDEEIGAVRAAHVARSLGAGQVLLGEVVGAGNATLVLNGTLLSASDAKPGVSASVTGSVDSLSWLADRLLVQLLAPGAEDEPNRGAGLPSTSLPALRAYLEGRSAYRRGDNVRAVGYYSRALALDSTFALAGLELVSALDLELHWSANGSVVGIPFGRSKSVGWGDAWRRGMGIAWERRDKLSARDRTYLAGLLGSRYPDPSPARDRLADWERAAQAFPDRADAWYRLGQILLYQGQSLGLAEWRDRARTAYLRALSLDSTFAQPLAGMLELSAREGDTTAVRRWARRYLARDSVGPMGEYERWHLAALTGDSAALRDLRRRLRSLESETLDRMQWSSQVEGIALDDADSAMAVMLEHAAGGEERAGALLSYTMLRLNQGRPREAMRLWRRMDDYLPGAYIHRALMYAVYWDGDSALAAATVRANPDAEWWVSQWRLWHGDTTGAATAIERLRRKQPTPSDPPVAAQVVYLEAILAQLGGRSDAAILLQAADSVARLGCCSQPHHGDIIVARVHEMAGDLPGALEAVRRQAGWFAPEYLSTALREEGRLAALTGDTVGAIAAWRHYLALRAHPEPERRAEVERVRVELTRLERGR